MKWVELNQYKDKYGFAWLQWRFVRFYDISNFRDQISYQMFRHYSELWNL